MLPRRSSTATTVAWRRALVGILAMAGGATVAVAPSTVAHATTSGATISAGTRGTIAPVRPAATTGAAARSQSALPPRGTRGTRAASASQSAAPAATAPVTSSTTTLQRNFNGVSSLDSAKTNYGAEFQPPDQGLCEGNGFVLEAVNSAYTVYDTAGHALSGPFNVNDLFNEGGAEFTSDPRCIYEASTNTWFAIVLFISSDSQSSHLDISVSTSGDPTKFWNFYRIGTTDSGGNGCPCFGDQPLIGIDQYNLYLSTNEFSILGPQFNGAQIYAIDKTALLNGANASFFHFAAPNIGGAQAASVQPATSHGAPNAEYFLSSLDPNGTNDHRVGVWAITNRDIHNGNSPLLSDLVISSEAYAFPVNPLQNSGTHLDGGDDRMQQTEEIAGAIWGELTTAIVISGDIKTRDAAAWFHVQPTITNKVLSGATMLAQGYEAVVGDYIIYPALAADAQNRAAMTFTVTNAQMFPSAGYATMGTGDTDFGAPRIAAHGSGPYVPTHPTTTRWGDYSWALYDQASHSFWFATEYVPPLSSQTPDGLKNWGTRVLQLTVS